MPPAEGGIHRRDIGRSRGGLTTKIHSRTNADWLAIGLHLTPGQASDMTSYTDLKQDDLPDPSALLADKGYDSDAIRADLEKRGVDPVIPTKSNRKIQRAISKTTCAMRNRIERFFNKIKHSRRVAPRCDQQPISFLGFVSLATIKVWIQSDDVAQSVLLVRGFPGGSAVTAARWPPGR